jgi:hypothetical protein
LDNNIAYSFSSSFNCPCKRLASSVKKENAFFSREIFANLFFIACL